MASLLNMSGAGLLNKPVPQDDNFVDMGLPSGTLWAKGNIVKDAQGNYSIGNETDYGCYFSWGNIDGHNAGDGYSFNQTNYDASAGASLTGNIPSNDAEHDAAVARLGGGCHLPTQNNFQELFNSAYTTRQWTSINGKNGYLLTSIVNGNTLFLQASGRCDGTTHNYLGLFGCYWNSKFNYSAAAYGLYFSNNSVNITTSYPRPNGVSIRPVK